MLLAAAAPAPFVVIAARARAANMSCLAGDGFLLAATYKLRQLTCTTRRGRPSASSVFIFVAECSPGSGTFRTPPRLASDSATQTWYPIR